jgi:hypothetical protein
VGVGGLTGDEMMKFKIDKKIPLPSRGQQITKYPFIDLDIGDSFLIPEKTVIQTNGLCYYAGKRLKKKFVSRTVNGGVRIWRIK